MNTYPVIKPFRDSMNEGTSLTPEKQSFLLDILTMQAFERWHEKIWHEKIVTEEFEQIKEAAGPLNKGKKLGVWVNGVLKLQTRNRNAIDEYYQKVVNEKLYINGQAVPRYHSVWVAPIGSFVTV